MHRVRAEVDMVGGETERSEPRFGVVMVARVIMVEEVEVEVGLGAVEVAGTAI
jgi:hypothetical protein